MKCLAAQDKNLVVLVDDLDRCNESEIRTVMSGLTTYLEAPHEEKAGRVAFVVAMDEKKIIQALQGSQESKLDRRNVIQKHFHLVIPVPIPTDSVLRKVLSATLDVLRWNVSLPKQRRMAHLVAVHAGSNLRLLRSAAVEAYTMARYYADVLKPQGIAVASELIDDPILRFRVALIREVSTADGLRRLFSDVRIWLGKEHWPEDVPKPLFDVEPRFARDRLDPRPLLGLAPGMVLASIAPATQDTIAALMENKEGELERLLDGYQPEALITLVSLIIAAGLPEGPPEQVGGFVAGLVGILHKAKESLDTQDCNTFVLLVDYLQRQVAHNRLTNQKYSVWVEVAASIGEIALQKLFQPGVPLLQGNHQQQSLKELVGAAKRGEVDGGLAYRLHVGLLGRKWESLFPVAVELAQAGKLGPYPEVHQLQIQCMERWNYVQKPEGPPRELYTKDLVKGIDKALHERAAKAYQIAANQQQEKTREFVAALPQEWPTEVRVSDSDERQVQHEGQGSTG